MAMITGYERGFLPKSQYRHLVQELALIPEKAERLLQNCHEQVIRFQREAPTENLQLLLRAPILANNISTDHCAKRQCRFAQWSSAISL